MIDGSRLPSRERPVWFMTCSCSRRAWESEGPVSTFGTLTMPLRWAEGAPAYAGCRPAGHDGPCLDGTAGSQGSPIRAQREHFPPIRSS